MLKYFASIDVAWDDTSSTAFDPAFNWFLNPPHSRTPHPRKWGKTLNDDRNRNCYRLLH